MARAATKLDLIEASKTNYVKLWKLINSMNEEVQTKEFNFEGTTLGKENHWKRDKNIRDVLIHLYEWHQLLLNWVNSNQTEDATSFLPSPYNWKTYGDMNVEFFKKHQDTPYEKSKEMIQKSHKEAMDLIEKFTNEELFVKGHFD